MSVEKAIELTTIKPLMVFDFSVPVGTVKPGSEADIGIFELQNGVFEFVDGIGAKGTGHQRDASSASSIASTMQQMSISLAWRLPVWPPHSSFPAFTQPVEMSRGIHKTLIGLGILTIAWTIVFRSLKSGDDVSQHKVLHPGG